MTSQVESVGRTDSGQFWLRKVPERGGNNTGFFGRLIETPPPGVYGSSFSSRYLAWPTMRCQHLGML